MSVSTTRSISAKRAFIAGLSPTSDPAEGLLPHPLSQVPVLVEEGAALLGVLDGGPEPLGRDRLDEEVVGAPLHRPHGRLDVLHRRHDDDRNEEPVLPGALEELEAALALEEDVEEEGDRLGPLREEGAGLLRRPGLEDRPAVQLEHPPDHRPGEGLIVDDEDLATIFRHRGVAESITAGHSDGSARRGSRKPVLGGVAAGEAGPALGGAPVRVGRAVPHEPVPSRSSR